MTTLTAEAPTLSPSNALTNTALLNAMAALHRLNELGLRVRYATANPITGAAILLDHPPSAELRATLQSGLKSRISSGQVTHETHVAHLLGCQVEWRIKRVPGAIAGQTVEVAA